MASYLSNKVQHQIINIGKDFITKDYKHSDHTCYVDSDYIIKWNLIESVFEDCYGDNFDIQKFAVEWFDEKIKRLFPVYMDLDFHFGKIDKNSFLTSIKHLEWTNRLEDIKKFFVETSVNDSTYCLEGILLLSSIFERALGNVYLLKGVTVPFLLRDLLSTPEVALIFEKVPILFAQILLGTPKSLNLRNLVWHGFPQNEELYPCYVSTLVLLLNSFGYILFKNDISNETIPARPQMNNLKDFSHVLLTYNNLPKIFNDLDIQRILHENYYLNTQLKSFDKIFTYYKTEQNGRFILLFLPQFEHFMRKYFCDKNCMTDRVKSAENNVLYITLDDMFEFKLKNNDLNEIYNEFNEYILVFYHDLFTYQEGPRIRDKFSHGEINFKDVPKEFVTILFTLFLLIICSVQTQRKYDILYSEFVRNFEYYNSVFHSNAILKYNILNLRQQLQLIPEFYSNSCVTDVIDFSNVANLIKQIEDYSKSIFTKFTGSLFDTFTIQKVPTLNRSKNEVRIICLFNRIIRIIINLDQSFRNYLLVKSNFFQSKQLRSRQRKSYCRMLTFVPLIIKTFEFVNYIVTFCALKIFQFEEIHHENIILRFFKKVLQVIEKIESNIIKDKNHWDLIKELIDEKVKLFEKFFNDLI